MNATAIGLMNNDTVNVFAKKQQIDGFLRDAKLGLKEANEKKNKSKRNIASYESYIEELEGFVEKLDADIIEYLRIRKI